MPIVQSLMDSLTAKYGEKRGEQVYYAMEAEGSGPFAPGGKYRHLHERWADEHEVPPSKATRTKKAPRGRRSGTGRAGRGKSYKRKR